MESNPSDKGGANQRGACGMRKRNFSNRTKTGCHTCRDRKKKCDEARPNCNNCTRGNLYCKGYGPKALVIRGFNGTGISRVHVPLQLKQCEQAPVPTGLYHMEPQYDHWGRIPPPPPPPSAAKSYSRYFEHDTRPVDDRDRWSGPTESWSRQSGSPSHQLNVLPPVECNHIAPHPSHSHYSHKPPRPPTPIPPPERWQHPITPGYRPHPGLGPTISSQESVGTSPSQRAPRLEPLSCPLSGQMSEKEKMLLGKPYLHYTDNVLLADRQQCKAAVERYNNAARPSRAISADERSRFFSAVVDPSKRREANQAYRDTAAGVATMIRPGRVGHRTIVEAPFNCD